MDAGKFIAKYWGKPGGAERATYQMFLTELALLLGADTPDPGEGGSLGDYQFEGPVSSEAVFFSKHNKRIDLYKRGHFILEAKQSQLKEGESLPEEAPEAMDADTDLFGNVTGYHAPKGKRAKKYDRLMADARVQAERYSLALPSGHKPPPFLIIADIGRTFELYFDWTGDGRGYGFFPDKQNYRIPLTALGTADPVGSTEKTAREILTAIWSDPDSIDPRRKAVAVTRDIAERLSRVAEALEADQRKSNPGKADFEVALGIENTSLFLMRVLFCMFAEDVELLPKGSFTKFLDEARSKSELWWQRGLTSLWEHMNQGDEHNRFWSYGDAIIRYFNGNLFKSARVYDLPQEFRGELFEASKRDWRAVEPAIFGTLLEQALTVAERAKLGAHYTPRPYVQRLVNATIGDVLTTEWHEARDRARDLESEGNHAEAVQVLTDFHNRLASQRILDPACGTGNFLYVAMELLLQLESEALELAAELGEALTPAVHPNQFLGLELNPRAAVIAELVLWIGWLRHRLANHPEAIGDPVLPTLDNINFGKHGGYDAVLRRTATGEPDVENPMQPDWPEAEFIVGNPPFIGKGEKMREALGQKYLTAMSKANPNVPSSANFVLQWWDRSAQILADQDSRLRRFGLVTTNTIRQPFNRKVIARHTANAELDRQTLSIVYAVPDHPWLKQPKDERKPKTVDRKKGPAAVRIAMTVCERGEKVGQLTKVVGEDGLNTDNPRIEVLSEVGKILPNLSVGVDTTRLKKLLSNKGMATNGVLLAGRGFVLSEKEAALFRTGVHAVDEVIRSYVSGSEIMKTPRNRYVIDFTGFSESEAAHRAPSLYQHLLETVAVARRKVADKKKTPDAISYAEHWWFFAKTREEFSELKRLSHRFIGTTETTKFRVFQFLDSRTVSDHMIVGIGMDDDFSLAVLSSSFHRFWTMAMCGMMGVATINQGHRYTKSEIFDTFPFPKLETSFRATIEALGRDLDAHRSAALAEVPKLTMTELYNLRELHRSGKATPQQQDNIRESRAGIVDRLHQQIDDAVADAYGWPRDLTAAEIVGRLVELNYERAQEEATGTIRWLRPDYQQPRFALKQTQK